MAPSLYRRTGDGAFIAHVPPQLEKRNATGGSTSPWLIVIIVIGALIVTILVVFLTLHLARKRRRIAQDGQIDLLGLEELKKHGMSTSDRQAAEEMERAIMIRKSLASRASSWSGVSDQTPETSEYQPEELDREEREPEPMATRENWKEFEAGAQSQRAAPGLFDAEIGVHPALLPQPQLAVPQPSRAPSLIRGYNLHS
ncbi:hypothetical protein F4818DRAFT_411382 [Hypoxylon cercidicola]|nr:hypothetical protein F4818DRAFT_411382 [Hypoxylon cercidicola]